MQRNICYMLEESNSGRTTSTSRRMRAALEPYKAHVIWRKQGLLGGKGLSVGTLQNPLETEKDKFLARALDSVLPEDVKEEFNLGLHLL